MEQDMKSHPMIGWHMKVTVDRPMGSVHPKHPDIVYPINYGYVKGVIAPDGEEQDVYLLGIDHPIEEYAGKIKAVIHRFDDIEEKWVIWPDGMDFTAEQIMEQTAFVEQYFNSVVITKGRNEMYIVCIGDSLTEGDYGVYGKSGIANIKEENYPYFLQQELNCIAVNAGKCGYTASSYLEYYEQGNVDVFAADTVVLMLGTNGGLHPSMETKGNADYRKLIALLQKDAPDAVLILCTPPHATENPVYSNCGYAPQVKDAAEYVRMTAEELKLPLIDLYAFDGFNAENEAIMQPNDGLHFGKEGYRLLAKTIADDILKIKKGE